MLKKKMNASGARVKLSSKNKAIGEFFEFRFHGIILGLDLTA